MKTTTPQSKKTVTIKDFFLTTLLQDMPYCLIKHSALCTRFTCYYTQLTLLWPWNLFEGPSHTKPPSRNRWQCNVIIQMLKHLAETSSQHPPVPSQLWWLHPDRKNKQTNNWKVSFRKASIIPCKQLLHLVNTLHMNCTTSEAHQLKLNCTIPAHQSRRERLPVALIIYIDQHDVLRQRRRCNRTAAAT